MKNIGGVVRQCLLAATTLLAALGSALAEEDRRDPVIYSFGDSLSDTGNLLSLGEASTVASSYYRGAFSNGPLWTDILSRHQALYPGLRNYNPTPSTNGINFAHAGSRSGRLVRGAPTDVSFLAQVEAFFELMQEGQIDPSHQDIFTVWTGANDYFLSTAPLVRSDPVLGDPEQVVQNIEDGLWQLIDGGAKTIIVMNLPDLAVTPSALEAGERIEESYREKTIQHNALLADAIDRIRAATDTNVIDIDVYALLADIIADPVRYGFSNVSDSCLDSGMPLDACPDDYLFYDGVHPTYAAHSLFALVVSEELGKLRR